MVVAYLQALHRHMDPLRRVWFQMWDWIKDVRGGFGCGVRSSS